jgi:hypothetical protein
MKKYGIPLEERRVHKGLLKELFHMSKKVDKSTIIYTDVGDNKESAFVFIPMSKGYNQLTIDKNKHKRIGHLLTALKILSVTCLFMWDARRSIKRHSLKQL